jgi:sirohydrochlorin ferrochelatase
MAQTFTHRKRHLLIKLAGLSLAGLLAGCAAAPDQPPVTQGEPKAVHHTKPDQLGRQLYSMKHPADPAMLAELRSKELFGDATDEEIMMMMGRMGPNYTWYASDGELQGTIGILILAHGFGDHGDQALRTQMLPTGQEVPVSFAFGMSMMMSDHIQLGLNQLTEAGATDIVIIPAVSTRHNTLKRQWDYVFALEDVPEYASVPRIRTPARLHYASPLEDHQLVGEIIVQYTKEVSQNSANEEVIIVGHGPVDTGDNQEQLAMMDSLADYIRASGDYAAVHVATLQDDAPPEVRRANVLALRAVIEEAQASGRDVLVVTNLLGTRMVQSSLRRDLQGLQYRFNSKGLVEHDNFVEWINLSVNENVEALKD